MRLIFSLCAALAVLTTTAAFAEDSLPPTGRAPIEARLVEFQAFDGSTERYFEWTPEKFDPAKSTTLIIALHGHGSDAGQIFSGVYAEYNATLDLAAERNAIVVSPDYRATTSWMGPAAEKDVLQIIAKAKAERRIDRVFFVGGSMGGSSALTFAALHPELVDGVVAMNPTANHIEYENFQDAIAASFGGSKKDVPLEYKNRSAEYFPERFLKIPTAITLGGIDAIVPPESARRLAQAIAALGGNVLCIERPELRHTTQYPDARAALEFVFDGAR